MIRRSRAPLTVPNPIRLLMAPLGIANDVASFLLDVPYQLGRDINTYFPAYRQWQFFAFGGDKWQGVAQLDSGPWRALGVLHVGNVSVRRRLFQQRFHY
jgi:hypothetical protein